jgi:hypothetical protein
MTHKEYDGHNPIKTTEQEGEEEDKDVARGEEEEEECANEDRTMDEVKKGQNNQNYINKQYNSK